MIDLLLILLYLGVIAAGFAFHSALIMGASVAVAFVMLAKWALEAPVDGGPDGYA